MTAQAPSVIYVAGYGRSGSTLLDVLLDAQPNVLGAGELTHLFRLAAEGKACSCGHPYLDCPVWGPAVRTTLRPTTAGLSAAAVLTRAVESGRTVAPRHVTRWAGLWQDLLAAAAEAAGATVVVDSSKSTRDTRFRAERLVGAGVPITMVVPVRNAAGVLTSSLAAEQRRRGPVPTTRRAEMLTVARTAYAWTTTMRSAIPAADVVVPFDLLTADAGRVIADLLGRPIGEIRLEGTGGHGVAGNRMRRQGQPIRPRPSPPTSSPGWLPDAAIRALDRVISGPRGASGLSPTG